MNEFFTLIGKEYLIVFIIAGLWLFERLKDLYAWVISGHTKRQAREQVMIKIDQYVVELDTVKGDNILIKQGMGALLQVRLIYECQRMLKQGFTTFEDLEVLENLYRPYHAMGFNGAGTRLHQKCLELPLKEEKK